MDKKVASSLTLRENSAPPKKHNIRFHIAKYNLNYHATPHEVNSEHFYRRSLVGFCSCFTLTSDYGRFGLQHKILTDKMNFKSDIV